MNKNDIEVGDIVELEWRPVWSSLNINIVAVALSTNLNSIYFRCLLSNSPSMSIGYKWVLSGNPSNWKFIRKL